MKLLPIGKQTFDQIIEGGYVYVDKTELIHKLISLNKPYFLSRPRRFGKSLLLSTIEHIFLGNRDLFKGLWIDDPKPRTESEPIPKYDWLIHPVVHLDMSATNKTGRVELDQSIKEQLYRIALDKNVSITGESPVSLFSSLILELYRQSGNVKIVILIDEYDAPIIDNIEDEDLAKEMRKSLQEFYAVLKSSEKIIRLIFITGVSKFAQASIFSKLNQLDDITLNPYYANICGFTSNDLNLYFNNYLNNFLYDLKSDESMPVEATTDDLINEILAWYNGYSWDGKTKLLNPFSLIKLLDTKDFSNFWFETGTPSFLMNLVKNNRTYFNLFQNDQSITANMNVLDIGNFSAKSLMFQTGYLTVSYIKRINKTKTYFLNFPNHEVRSSFFAYLLADISSFNHPNELWVKAEELREALIQQDAEKASLAFSVLLGTIPWRMHVQAEGYYHTIFFMALGFIGNPIQVEVATGDGIIDAVLDVPRANILVLEMKYMKFPGKSVKVIGEADVLIIEEQTSEVEEPKPTEDDLVKINKLLDDGVVQAFEQINSRKYTDKYQLIGRKITKIAIVVCKRNYVKVVFKNE